MRFNKISLAAMLLGGSAFLAACGGSDSGGGSALTVDGTAAIGKALVSPLSLTCKTGKGTGTSNSDGSFTVVINDGAGPCLLKMTTTDGVTLYSISHGSTPKQTANITPLTTLLVHYLRNVPGMTAATPEAWFDLPQVKTLLADTDALKKRIVEEFIPALNKLYPTLNLPLDANFLFEMFDATPNSPGTDAYLEKLKELGLVDGFGKLLPEFLEKIIKEALDDNDNPKCSGQWTIGKFGTGQIESTTQACQAGYTGNKTLSHTCQATGAWGATTTQDGCTSIPTGVTGGTGGTGAGGSGAGTF